jgi:hypothetical protein
MTIHHSGGPENRSLSKPPSVECLTKNVDWVPVGQDVPKEADFVHWSDFMADTIASGPGAKELRLSESR